MPPLSSLSGFALTGIISSQAGLYSTLFSTTRLAVVFVHVLGAVTYLQKLRIIQPSFTNLITGEGRYRFNQQFNNQFALWSQGTFSFCSSASRSLYSLHSRLKCTRLFRLSANLTSRERAHDSVFKQEKITFFL